LEDYLAIADVRQYFKLAARSKIDLDCGDVLGDHLFTR
jgi:hypothetical protein